MTPADRIRQAAIAKKKLQHIDDQRLSRPEDEQLDRLMSRRAKVHYAGFDRVPPPDSLIDEMLGQTDADAQAWVEGRA